MQKPLVCCYMGVSECFSDIWKIGWGLLNSPGMCYCFIPFHIMGSELPMSEHSLCKAFSGTDNRLIMKGACILLGLNFWWRSSHD